MAIRFEAAAIQRDAFTLALDFAIPQGASVALIGPSGGGKSTVLEAIAGFLPLSAGTLHLLDRNVADEPPASRPVTLLFQDHNLFPHLTVTQNVGLGLRPDLRLNADQKARVAQALTDVGLDGFGGRRPAALSGGQRQRVALARALLRDRPILLLDEPFAALGPALRREMLDLVMRIRDQSGATLVMVTHQPEDARHVAQMTALVEGGMVHPPAPTEALFADPPKALRDYLE